MQMENEWAIVLAAGDGTRLSALTDAGGARVPKQFWSLRGSRSLLGDALQRAFQLVPRRRTLVVVAEKHRALWEAELGELPPENVIVQPTNRGTAAGLLLPLLAILKRDPRARVLVLPSDHFVEKEYVLTVALRLGLESLGRDARRLVLLGIGPTSPETGYGWILPRPGSGTLDRVSAFVEKPAASVARTLMARGGLWNSFMMVARAQVLLELFERRRPELAARLIAAVESGSGSALAEQYEELEPADFSRDLLQGSEEELWLLRVPECGWTDLGTPERVAQCVARLDARARRARGGERTQQGGRLSLAAALRRIGLVDPRPAVEAAAGISVT